MEPQNNQSQPPTKGYGKRPVWQWVLIYLVVAVIVYGLIYFFFIKGGSTASSGY